jgi:UDP-N-acetylmuramate--alanine ligase
MEERKPNEKLSIFSNGVKSIYLVGIGGAGMSGLALLLKGRGFQVRGSDLKDSASVRMLKDEGIEVFIGHRKEQVNGDTDIVGYSSAISEDNPELTRAKARGIRIFKRAELLAELCKGRKAIAVSGSHGKTTTTSLLGYLLTSLGYKPAVFIGGVPLNYFRGAWWGEDYFVIEADESDGSFLFYDPWVSIITNVDREHLDYYRSEEKLKEGFYEFAAKARGEVIASGDQPYLKEVLAKTGGISFGWNRENTLSGANFSFDGKYSCFDLYRQGNFITTLKTALIGRHNCLNILAVCAFFYYLGEDLGRVKQVLPDFKGTRRRFEAKGEIKGVSFIDDYAHHPTEIAAVLAAARLLSPKRLVVIFQPHRFSRTAALKSEFTRCFSNADQLVITDIYAASEENTSKVSVQGLTEEISRNSSVKADYIPKHKLSTDIPSRLKKGDLVLGLGAGDINIVMEEVRGCL